MKLPSCIVISQCLTIASTAYADATYTGAEIALLHESNIGHAEYDKDVQEDTSLLLSADISRSLRLTYNSGLVARAGLQLNQQAHHDDLSFVSIHSGLRYRLQPLSGFTMPWIDIGLNAARTEYQDSPIRDGWITALNFGVGKYFTDRLRMTAGWLGERRHAEDSRVFDLRSHGWQMGVDFQLNPRSALYAKAVRREGDQVSSAPQSSLSGSPLQYETQTADSALSEHGKPRNAYRFDAITRSLELGYNHAIRENMALDISAFYFEADARGGHTYEGYSARAGLLYRF